MADFDPSKLNQINSPSSPKKVQAERLFMAVDGYETPDDNFHYAVGHRLENPEEKIRVRLNTVDDRMQDRPNGDRAKVEALYVTSDNHRDNIADKAKSDIKLLSFDDARPVGNSADGVPEYRAHWGKTMSTDPNAEVMMGLAHVRLRGDDADKQKGSVAQVEMIRSSATADSNNIDAVLQDALSIKDDEGRARRPAAILRVSYEGEIVASPRVYPATEASSKFDQATGQKKDIQVPVDAEKTIERLMEGGHGKNEFESRQLDSVRAVVSGLKGMDEPKFDSTDPKIQESMQNLHYGAKGGHLQVEVIAVDNLEFGADSRKTYIKDKEQGKPQLNVYDIKEQDGDRQRQTPGYAETVVATMRHPDGEPYVVFASPAEMYPKPQKLKELDTSSIPEPEVAARAKVEAERPAPQTPTESKPEPKEESYGVDGP